MALSLKTGIAATNAILIVAIDATLGTPTNNTFVKAWSATGDAADWMANWTNGACSPQSDTWNGHSVYGMKQTGFAGAQNITFAASHRPVLTDPFSVVVVSRNAGTFGGTAVVDTSGGVVYKHSGDNKIEFAGGVVTASAVVTADKFFVGFSNNMAGTSSKAYYGLAGVGSISTTDNTGTPAVNFAGHQITQLGFASTWQAEPILYAIFNKELSAGEMDGIFQDPIGSLLTAGGGGGVSIPVLSLSSRLFGD